jgi:hypothetical protein
VPTITRSLTGVEAGEAARPQDAADLGRGIFRGPATAKERSVRRDELGTSPFVSAAAPIQPVRPTASSLRFTPRR